MIVNKVLNMFLAFTGTLTRHHFAPILLNVPFTLYGCLNLMEETNEVFIFYSLYNNFK